MTSEEMTRVESAVDVFLAKLDTQDDKVKDLAIKYALALLGLASRKLATATVLKTDELSKP